MTKKAYITTETLLEEIKLKDPEAYREIIEDSEREIERIKASWGGKRSNAGRKKQYSEKIKETFDLEKTDVINLKEYAKKHKISKNKAIQEAIRNLTKGSEGNKLIGE